MSLRIVELASEVVPFAKTGGLADVAGALSRALARRGHEVHVVLPLHGSIAREKFRLKPAGFSVPAALAGGPQLFDVWTIDARPGSEKVWFLAHPWFDRPGLYGDKTGEYGDNHLRFAAFCRAAEALVARVCPDPDILHLHDWQAALAAVDLRADGVEHPPGFRDTRIVFTIHNLAYSGAFPPEALSDLGLPPRLYSPDALEFYGRLALIKGGLVFADALTTVSPRYAREIQTAEFGSGLDGLLRARGTRLVGILNGIDTEEWDPEHDAALPAPFNAEHVAGKARCKEALQREAGLHDDPDAMVFGVVARLAWQKGLDLVADVAPGLLHRGCQLVLLGTGEAGIEQRFQALANEHPGRVSVRFQFDEGYAHRIEAGSDAFLMPSRYEPCGLNQLYSLRYGSVPIVRAVGGLDDTVEELDSVRGTGTGFKFGAATPQALWAACERAMRAYGQREVWTDLRRRGMMRDFSWNASAAAYETLFAGLAGTPASGAELPGESR